MTHKLTTNALLAAGVFIFSGQAAFADKNHSHDTYAINQKGAVLSDADSTKTASFDILAAHVHRNENQVTFHMTTNGQAGADKPQAKGKVPGAIVWSYVWPTSLDPSNNGPMRSSEII